MVPPLSPKVTIFDSSPSGLRLSSPRDVPQWLSWPHRLYVNLRASSHRFLACARESGHFARLLVFCQSPVESTRSGIKRFISSRYWANLGALLWRFLTFVWKPRDFGFLLSEYLLLVWSNWSGRQLELGPDVVYPLLSIKTRRSGRPGRLIVEHCRYQQPFELCAKAAFPDGIDPPCVAVIDLDRVPRNIVENGYSTQVDLPGLVCMLILIETIVTLILHIYYLQDQKSWTRWINWIVCFLINTFFCWPAIAHGDGILTLARRSDTSTPGCAVLLDQDLTVVLNGDQSTVEAIAESSFNLCYPASAGRGEARDPYHYSLEALGEGIWVAVSVLCGLLLFRPSTPIKLWGLLAGLNFAVPIFVMWQRRPSPRQWRALKPWLFHSAPVVYLGLWYFGVVISNTPIVVSAWHFAVLALFSSLLVLFSVGFKARNYPIRSAKLLDAFGHPHVRKWQFDTLAAAATFQCLVICHGVQRPIKAIDVLAFLNMLIPDQRDVWEAWKERVADRIVHEIDISFMPTIPTFPDERQRQFKDLLDQAQFGNDTYIRLYSQGVHPDSTVSNDVPSSIFASIRSTVQRFFSSSSSTGQTHVLP